jgi:hypothetical protein
MEDFFNGWHACFLVRIATLRLYVIGRVQVMVWIGPSFVHGSDVSRLYVDGDIFACIWIELMSILVQVGPWCEWERFSSTSQAFYGVWLVVSSISSALFSFILLR